MSSQGQPLRRWGRRFLCAPLLLAAVMEVLAQQGGPQRPVLQALDTDHDGTLSAGEIKASPQSLHTLDRNGDGVIAGDELQPRPENAGATPDQLVQQLMLFDKNGDGALTADELPSRFQALMQHGDTNHDGRLTSEEIRTLTAHQSMPAGAAAAHAGARRNDPLSEALDTDHDGTLSASEIAAAPHSLLTLDKNSDGEITADEMRPRQPSPEERVNHLMEEWDTNQDGKLSKAEAPDRLQRDFASVDTNEDGFLDRSELLTYFSATANQNSGQPHEATDAHSNTDKGHN